jgi:hypothetical protein
MESTLRHPRTVRLLKLTVAALVLSWAFADAARANLASLGPSSAPVAPVSSIVGDLSSTVDETLGATTATDDALGTVQATVEQTQMGLGETTGTTVASVGETVEEISGSASSTLEETVDQTLGNTPTLAETLDETLGGMTSTLSETLGSPPSIPAPAPPSGLLPVDGPHFEPSPPSSAVSPEAPPGVLTSPDEPVPAPSFADASAPSSQHDASPVKSPATRPMTSAARARGSVTNDVRPALVGTALRRPTRGSTSWQLPRLPDLPSPGGPAGSLTALLQSSSGAGLLVLGALFGLWSLLRSAGVGPRLRFAAELPRPPDVLFRLERPG